MVRTMNGFWFRPAWPCMFGHGVEQEADGDRVAGLEHGVGEDQKQADIEGHQRADDVLGLRILTAGRGDRRGHLRIDHGDAGIEQAGDPAGDQAGDHAAFADGEIPAHVLADEHDADAERPDMAGPSTRRRLSRSGRRRCCVGGGRGCRCRRCHGALLRSRAVPASARSRLRAMTSAGRWNRSCRR